MEVNFEGETLENMKKLAEEAGLTPEGFIEVVMEQFLQVQTYFQIDTSRCKQL